MRSPRPLDEVPASVQRVDSSDIQDTKATITLDESLVGNPGLFFQNPYNFAQDLRLSIRGFGMRAPFGIRGVKILVDGIPETLPDGQTQVDVIDPGGIDHIEILRGPSSSLYGNASGGVLRISTLDGPESGIKIQPEFRFGGFGMIKNQIQWGEGRKGFRFNLYASRFFSNGFRNHSETEQSLIRGKFKFSNYPQSEWLVMLGHFNSPQAKDPGALTQDEVQKQPELSASRNITFDASERVQQQNLGVSYRRQFSDSIEVLTTLYLIRRKFSNKLPFEKGGMVAFNRNAPGLGIKLIREGHNGNHRLILGLESAAQRDNRRRFENLQGERGEPALEQREQVTSFGTYIRSEWKTKQDWGFNLGIRYDRLFFQVDDFYLIDGDQSGDRSLAEWSGSLGSVYHLKSETNLFINISTAFEAPTTTELINNPSGQGGFNPNLDSQYSVNYEFGVRGSAVNQKLKYGISSFYIISQDELVSFQSPVFSSRLFFRNAGKTERRGLEIDLHFRPLKTWMTRFSYTYSDFRFVHYESEGQNLAGKFLPGIPQHRSYAKLGYRSPHGYFGEGEIQFIEAFPVDNKNSRNSPSYFLGNIRFGLTEDWGSMRYSAFIGFNNIFNESYNANVRINGPNDRFFEPGPPFNVFGGFSIVYNSE